MTVVVEVIIYKLSTAAKNMLINYA